MKMHGQIADVLCKVVLRYHSHSDRVIPAGRRLLAQQDCRIFLKAHPQADPHRQSYCTNTIFCTCSSSSPISFLPKNVIVKTLLCRNTYVSSCNNTWSILQNRQHSTLVEKIASWSCQMLSDISMVFTCLSKRSSHVVVTTCPGCQGHILVVTWVVKVLSGVVTWWSHKICYILTYGHLVILVVTWSYLSSQHLP